MFVRVKSNNAIYSIGYGYSQHKARYMKINTSFFFFNLSQQPNTTKWHNYLIYYIILCNLSHNYLAF